MSHLGHFQRCRTGAMLLCDSIVFSGSRGCKEETAMNTRNGVPGSRVKCSGAGVLDSRIPGIMSLGFELLGLWVLGAGVRSSGTPDSGF